MAVFDERGRLFGRFNVFDVIIAVIVLWLIPIAYAGYLMFRAPSPTLTAVEPKEIVYGPDMKIRVRGTHFAPYLRVSIGPHQGKTFKFSDTTDAEVDIFETTPPGVYDLVLFDNSQERDRLKNALTILPSALPQAKLVAVGTLSNLTEAEAATLKPGSVIPGIGEIEQVGKLRPQLQRAFVRPNNVEIPIPDARMLPVVLRLSCYVRSAQGQPECINGFSIQPTSLLFFDMFGRQIPFQIDQVRGVTPLVPLQVTVRFSGDPRVIGQMKVGDTDYGEIRNELGAAARIERLDAPGGSAREARLTVQGQLGDAGWLFANVPLRAGAAFAFRTSGYEVTGNVLTVDAPAEPTSK